MKVIRSYPGRYIGTYTRPSRSSAPSATKGLPTPKSPFSTSNLVPHLAQMCSRWAFMANGPTSTCGCWHAGHFIYNSGIPAIMLERHASIATADSKGHKPMSYSYPTTSSQWLEEWSAYRPYPSSRSATSYAARKGGHGLGVPTGRPTHHLVISTSPSRQRDTAHNQSAMSFTPLGT